MKQINKTKHVSDLLLILWAGGAALLSYSLVYALRKPYTAAAFEGLEFFGSDYKVAVTTIQILGYVISKFFGIKIISELKRENRFRFFRCFGSACRGCFGWFRHASDALQRHCDVRQRFVAWMYVGSDFQLYRGAQGY